MPAGTYNFEIEQGATFTKVFRVRQKQEGQWSPFILTGYTIRMMARHNYGDATPVISLSTIDPPGGLLITDGPGGAFQITLTKPQTALLNFTEIRYDIEIQAPNGTVMRLLKGTMGLSKENTK
jgi:hypothetical protein